MGASPGLLASLRALGLDPRPGEPLARLGYWRMGGPADVYVEVGSVEALLGAFALGEPVTVLGNGSNLLVADAGIYGLTVRLTGALREARIEGDEAWVGAGLLNTVLLSRLARAGKGGLGCLAGVPGTVGGAVRMNAGTVLGEIGPRVRSIEVVLPGGEQVELPGEALGFDYRTARLPEGAVILGVRLRLESEPEAVSREQEAMQRHLKHRKETQPLDLPSCGSVFRNPPGQAAGRLIEGVGLKGTRRGDAAISEKHANFIVNLGQARAMDCWELIRLARDRVWAETGTVLVPEVHAVGEWPQGHWPLPQPG